MIFRNTKKSKDMGYSYLILIIYLKKSNIANLKRCTNVLIPEA